MRSVDFAAKAVALTILSGAGVAPGAHAAPFNDLFVFGDSYSDTGALLSVTNGPTAVSYLAQRLGVTLTTPQNPNPGTNGVNFAESGARVDAPNFVSPLFPPGRPLSLTQQVGEFQSYVTSGALTFDPSTSLFMLLGGLNDHTAPASDITAATAAQVSQLYALGARHIEVGLLPSLSPVFADSAANLNPAYTALVPQLQAQFPNAQITLSNWGPFYEQVLSNASQYGFTNTAPAGCLNPTTFAQTCTTPDSYYFYYPDHPSTATDRIVGNLLYQEALGLQAVPEPISLAVIGTGLLGLALVRRGRGAGGAGQSGSSPARGKTGA